MDPGNAVLSVFLWLVFIRARYALQNRWEIQVQERVQ
jgi:hypothetical protein